MIPLTSLVSAVEFGDKLLIEAGGAMIVIPASRDLLVWVGSGGAVKECTMTFSGEDTAAEETIEEVAMEETAVDETAVDETAVELAEGDEDTINMDGTIVLVKVRVEPNRSINSMVVTETNMVDLMVVGAALEDTEVTFDTGEDK